MRKDGLSRERQDALLPWYLWLTVVLASIGYLTPLIPIPAVQTLGRAIAVLLMLALVVLSIYAIRLFQKVGFHSDFSVLPWTIAVEKTLAILAVLLIAIVFNDLTTRTVGGEVLAIVEHITNTFLPDLGVDSRSRVEDQEQRDDSPRHAVVDCCYSVISGGYMSRINFLTTDTPLARRVTSFSH